MKYFRVFFGIGFTSALLSTLALTVAAEDSANVPQPSENLVIPLVLIVFALLLIIGYFPGVKKYLPKAIYYKSTHNPHPDPEVCCPYRLNNINLLSLLLPYVPVEASIELFFMVHTPTHGHFADVWHSTRLKIRAKSKSSAIFVNAVEQLVEDGYALAGTAVPLAAFAAGIADGLHVAPPQIVLHYNGSKLKKDRQTVAAFVKI